MIDLILKLIADGSSLDSKDLAGSLGRTQDLTRGDYTLQCFALAKKWEISPPQAAARLKESLKLPAEIEKVEAVGPYLNFFLNRSMLAQRVVKRVLQQGPQIGKNITTAKKIVLEFSSPNIAKPFHVGHLRNIMIGRSLELIFRHIGHQVSTVDHLGDWGTQFGFVYAGCELWGKPDNPGIEELVGLYIKASALRKAQEEGNLSAEDKDKPDVNQMARDYFKRLEADDKEAHAFWKWCLDISLQYFDSIYGRLGFKFDFQHGEAFYRDKIERVEQAVRASGILEESRGALGVDLGKKLGFVRIFTEDGRSLYITRDIACAFYRFETFSPDKILYVVASQQALHFQQLIEILRRMKHPVAELITHVAYGIVPGMKTRAGTVIGLKEFLDEAKERALQSYREEVAKRPEGIDEEQMSEQVGIGATAFYFLSHSNVKEFNFSWKEALNFQGDSGPYIQYAHARLSSILQKAEEAGLKPTQDFKPELLADDAARELCSLIDRFEEKLLLAAESYEAMHLANYALDLARSFSACYKGLRVIGEAQDLAQARLSLFAALRYVLQTSLRLIGVPPVERM